MNRNNIYNSCMMGIVSDTPVMFLGAPGIGKTAIIDSLPYPIMHIDAGTADALTFRGLPNSVNDVTTWDTPAWLAEINDLAAEHEYVVVFLDEISKLSAGAEGPVYSLVNERRVETHKLPRNVRFIMAGNLPKHKAYGDRAPNPVLTNRCLTVELDGCDTESFLAWGEHSLHPLVHKFLREKPDHIFNFDGTRLVNATPRSWEAVSRNITAIEDGHMGDVINSINDSLPIISSSVPSAYAEAFLLFANSFGVTFSVADIIESEGDPWRLKKASNVKPIGVEISAQNARLRLVHAVLNNEASVIPHIAKFFGNLHEKDKDAARSAISQLITAVPPYYAENTRDKVTESLRNLDIPVGAITQKVA